MDDHSGSKVVATHGRGEGLYLLQRDDGQGQVANKNKGRMFAPRPMDSFMARGDWVQCDDVDLADVLALIGPLARLKKLTTMIAWALLHGRFEPEDQRRIPLGRALRSRGQMQAYWATSASGDHPAAANAASDVCMSCVCHMLSLTREVEKGPGAADAPARSLPELPQAKRGLRVPLCNTPESRANRDREAGIGGTVCQLRK